MDVTEMKKSILDGLSHCRFSNHHQKISKLNTYIALRLGLALRGAHQLADVVPKSLQFADGAGLVCLLLFLLSLQHLVKKNGQKLKVCETKNKIQMRNNNNKPCIVEGYVRTQINSNTHLYAELPVNQQLNLATVNPIHLEGFIAQFVPLLAGLFVVKRSQGNGHTAHKIRCLDIVVVLDHGHKGQCAVHYTRKDVLRVPHGVQVLPNKRGFLLVETDQFQAHLGIRRTSRKDGMILRLEPAALHHRDVEFVGLLFVFLRIGILAFCFLLAVGACFNVLVALLAEGFDLGRGTVEADLKVYLKCK